MVNRKENPKTADPEYHRKWYTEMSRKKRLFDIMVEKRWISQAMIREAEKIDALRR